jgi:hypothetical protein
MKTQFIHGKQKSGNFFLIFGRTMAIENLKKDLILPILVFNFTFWL